MKPLNSPRGPRYFELPTDKKWTGAHSLPQVELPDGVSSNDVLQFVDFVQMVMAGASPDISEDVERVFAALKGMEEAHPFKKLCDTLRAGGILGCMIENVKDDIDEIMAEGTQQI